MLRTTYRLGRLLAAAIAVVAIALPATSTAAPGYQDLRNPDSRAPAMGTQEAELEQTPAVAPPPNAEEPSFDWGDAGIGAGSAVGLLLIGLAVALTISHRRNRTAAT